VEPINEANGANGANGDTTDAQLSHVHRFFIATENNTQKGAKMEPKWSQLMEPMEPLIGSTY